MYRNLGGFNYFHPEPDNQFPMKTAFPVGPHTPVTIGLHIQSMIRLMANIA